MALSIKNKEVEENARVLARLTGKPLTQAVNDALIREIKREKGIKHILSPIGSAATVQRLQREYANLHNPMPMSDDEILGYDECGIPTK